jgi:hypothetical protein
MKTLTLIILISGILSACATAIPYSNEEECAKVGMVPDGVAIGSASTIGYNYNAGVTTVSTSSSTLMCRVPTSQVQQCQVKHLQESMAPKERYNSKIGEKKLLTGLAYLIYVIPGIGVKLMFDRESLDSENESQEISSNQEACDTRETASLKTSP